MKPIFKKPSSEHHELSQLLPWYVNKTLQGSELKALEDHLTFCLTCKRDLIQIQKLAQAVNQEGSLDSAEQATFSRLKKRLHTGQPLDLESLPQQVLVEQPKIQPFNGNSRRSNPRKRGWLSRAMSRPVLALAAVFLFSLSLLMPRHTETGLQQGNNFRTLSDTQQEPISANEIRVVFADNVNQEQKNKIVARVHGQFIGDNPTAQGVYTIRLDSGIAVKRLLDVVDSLRKDSNVIFAEPAYALLSSTHREK
jgi:hypothetical protein